MCSVAVDFAKHGECVSKANYKAYQDPGRCHPDFMEKDPARTYQSEGVLGHLYRDIKNDSA